MWPKLALRLLAIILCFSACSPSDRQQVDKLNSLSYAYHYRSLDSTEHYAREALAWMSTHGNDYADGYAEALNNLAFVSVARMDYEKAKRYLDSIPSITDNQIELLVADVQQMRLCQRRSFNREFYDYREKAQRELRRIDEERHYLTPRQKQRLLYAESEMPIVESTYFYYVGLERQSVAALDAIPNELESDTAQWLNYLYNVGAGGVIDGRTQEEVDQREYDYLMRCYLTSLSADYPYFVANSLEAIAEHLAVPDTRRRLVADNLPSMKFLFPTESFDVQSDSLVLLPIRLAERSLKIFNDYGDVYQISGAYRSLATCYRSKGDYASALYNLEQALGDSAIYQAPDLIASIREQLSVAYAAINDKAASDHNRNLYLDLQEQTRQDRSLEARADQLDKTVAQLNFLLWAVLAAIILLLFLLWLFNRMYQRRKSATQTDIQEQLAIHQLSLEAAQRLHLEQRAKVSLMVSITPFIDRMIHAIKRTVSTDTACSVHADTDIPSELSPLQQWSLGYIRELTDKIVEQNNMLTDWIQLRKGELSLHIESFPLQSLFDMLVKGKASFAMKGIELMVSPTEAWVKADRVLTLFMLNTLADNARKFTPAGGTVSVSATETADYVEVAVADTGMGIDENQLAHLFDSRLENLCPPPDMKSVRKEESHGFGLLNCKGIIDKYRKMSQIFSVCLLSAESEVGKGSRFFFRLPKGVVRLLLPLLVLVSSFLPAHAVTPMEQAKAYVDSAYFSNINGTYLQTLLYVDSCRHCLNDYYRELTRGTDTLTLIGDPSVMAHDIQWFHAGLPVNYGIILDMRNEAAVAALALHEWALYSYNNRIYTLLFKETSADSSLDDYCRTMQRSRTDKSIAVALLLLLLLAIVPAYFFLYYRRRQHLDDVEQSQEQLRRIELEEDRLHVSNAVLDNCLSTLKHETMYFPSRIRQLVDRCEMASLPEVAQYYRELYGVLSQQAMRQAEGTTLNLKPLHHELLGDETLVRYLFDILRRQSGQNKLDVEYRPYDAHFVEVRVSMPRLQLSADEAARLFEPSADHIPFFLCRQIVREHGEAIHRTDFGIKAEVDASGGTIIILKLPRQSQRLHNQS